MLNSPTTQPHINPEHAALKARVFQRHGSVVGQLVLASEVNRRRLQDERHVELVAELTANHNQTSELAKAAGQKATEISGATRGGIHRLPCNVR